MDESNNYPHQTQTSSHEILYMHKLFINAYFLVDNIN